MRPSLSTASAGLSVWIRQPAGHQRIERAALQRKARAAVLHQHAGRRQHAARAEFPIERLDVGHDEARRVGCAHPDRVALARGQRPGRRLAAVDLHRFAGDEALIEIAVERVREEGRIGDGAIAGADRALGRLDQAVDVIETFCLGHTQAVEQREDHQRGNTLGRRAGVVDRAAGEIGAQRLGDLGLIAVQILARDRAADAFEIGGDFAPDIAAVEIVEAGMGELFERRARAPAASAWCRPPAPCRPRETSWQSPGTSLSSARWFSVSRFWLRVTP